MNYSDYQKLLSETNPTPGAGTGAATVATIAALVALASSALANGAQIDVMNYASPLVTLAPDGGGGAFAWRADSTATPDNGVTFAPTDKLLAVAGENLGAGDGATLTYAGVLAQKVVNPGSLSVTSGAVTFTDDGAGNLLVAGLPSGSINYTTGAWSVTFSAAPTGAIAASYKAVQTPGRWVRQYDGMISARWWGADGDAASAVSRDSSAAIQAADSYAFSKRAPLMVQGNFKTSYTIVLSGSYTTAFAAGGSDGGNNGSSITFRPASNADLYPAFTFSGASRTPVVEGIYVQSEGTAYTASLLPAVMPPAAFGDLSLYTTVPKYSDLVAGPVAFSMNGTGASPTFRNCGSSRVKFGLVLDNTDGHVESQDCNWSGLAGVYCKRNSESYKFINGSVTGQLAGVMFGDTLWVGHYGGLSGSTLFENIDFGFSPYAFFQVHDNPTPITDAVGGISGTLFLNCGFEAIGEAAFRLLPNAEFGPHFINCNPPGYPGSWNSDYSLPAAYTMANGHGAFWISAGWLGQFKWDGFGTGSWANSAVAAAPKGVAIIQGSTANANYTNPFGAPLRAQDLAFFGSGLVVVDATGAPVANPQLDTTRPNFVSASRRLELATKNVLALKRDFAPQRNLLMNPEVPANWTIYSGATPVVGSYSSFGGALPALDKLPQDMVQELGLNPKVVKLTATTDPSVNAALPFADGAPTVIPHPQNVGYSFWVYCGSAADVAIGSGVNTSNGQLYANAENVSAARGWKKVWRYGQNAFQNQNAGNDNYWSVSVGSGPQLGVGNSYYVAGVMAFTDEIAPYNPYSGPTAGAPIGTAQFTYDTLPNPQNYQPGAITYCADGRNTGEGAGAGTGCPVFVKAVGGGGFTWAAVWSGQEVTK